MISRCSSLKNPKIMKPHISVVIPVYNGEKTLFDTLTSVLKQTYICFDVIIVDNGSDHPVESFIHPLMKDSRIRVCRIERSNANIARNYGIMESKGEYIAMLDADDYWQENHLQECLELLQHSDADGLYGSLFLRRSLSSDIQGLQISNARELKKRESMVNYLLTTGYGAQTSTLFATANSMKDILWDPELKSHQDYDFVVRFCKKYKMTVKKNPTVSYYLSSGRVQDYESCIRFIKNNIKDINPVVYMQYNLNMYMQTRLKEELKKFASYYKNEAVRYKDYISYQRYVSVCNPQSCIQKWMEKLKYILQIVKT